MLQRITLKITLWTKFMMMILSAYNTFNINSCLLENETLKTERRLAHHDDQIAHHDDQLAHHDDHLAHHGDHLAHHDDHLAHHDNQLAKLHQQLKPQTSEGSTANGSYQFILCSFVIGFYLLMYRGIRLQCAILILHFPALMSSLCPSICPICAVNFSHFFVHVSWMLEFTIVIMCCHTFFHSVIFIYS